MPCHILIKKIGELNIQKKDGNLILDMIPFKTNKKDTGKPASFQ